MEVLTTASARFPPRVFVRPQPCTGTCLKYHHQLLARLLSAPGGTGCGAHGVGERGRTKGSTANYLHVSSLSVYIPERNMSSQSVRVWSSYIARRCKRLFR